MDCSPPGSSVHGISQARILEWGAVSYSRGSSQPRDWTYISCIPRRVLFFVYFQAGVFQKGCHTKGQGPWLFPMAGGILYHYATWGSPISLILSLKPLWGWNLAYVSLGPWWYQSAEDPRSPEKPAHPLFQRLRAHPRPTEYIPVGSSALRVWSVGLAHPPFRSPCWHWGWGDPIESSGIGITLQGLAYRNSTNICCVDEGVGRLLCSSRASGSYSDRGGPSTLVWMWTRCKAKHLLFSDLWSTDSMFHAFSENRKVKEKM